MQPDTSSLSSRIENAISILSQVRRDGADTKNEKLGGCQPLDEQVIFLSLIFLFLSFLPC
jgi:hypothetical protein